jgi:cell division protein FtsB
MTFGGRLLLTGAIVIVILGGLLAGFLLGRHSASSGLAAADVLNQQLQTEGQKLKRQITDLSAKSVAQEAKLTSVQSALDAIMPSENTYNISPNQSIILAGGHLTIGLIGSPTNEGINININGKSQSVAAGDVIKVALDTSTTCQIGIQSFDMFKAILTATCPGAKPQ